MNIVILPPLFLPPPFYFEKIAGADLAVIDTSLRYDKRNKAVHRTVITSAHGPSFLTVPVNVPRCRNLKWEDVNVSPHGEWWRIFRLTMATLYGPTPYFDLYKDELFTSFTQEAIGRKITDLDLELLLSIMKLSHIRTHLSVSLDRRYTESPDSQIEDLRAYDFYAGPDERSVIETLFQTGSIN